MPKLWPPKYSNSKRVRVADRVIWKNQEWEVFCLYVDKDDKTNVTLWHEDFPETMRLPRVNSKDLERVK